MISNASDAIDKRHFKSLTDASLAPEGFEIHLAADEDARTLTISDSGIGMTKEELEHNLGTIAQSGSLAFKQENQTDDTDIIGVRRRLHASFMVLPLMSRSFQACGSEQAYIWESDGADGYTIEPGEKDSITDIILTIKKRRIRKARGRGHLQRIPADLSFGRSGSQVFRLHPLPD